jgi:mono/diheme cytochrome c family protein
LNTFRDIRLAVLLLALVAAGSLQDQDSKAPAPAMIAHGRYLVHHVAMCVQCHTPRDGDGNLMPLMLLKGAAMPIQSPFPHVEWAYRAQHIAGLPGYTVEQGVRLLTEGITASGGRPKAPMPPFRMTREDAEAVVAYLKSLD